MNDFGVRKEVTIITQHGCILVGFSDRFSIFRRWSYIYYIYYSVSVGKGTDRGELGEKVEFEERERGKGGR